MHTHVHMCIHIHTHKLIYTYTHLHNRRAWSIPKAHLRTSMVALLVNTSLLRNGVCNT